MMTKLICVTKLVGEFETIIKHSIYIAFLTKLRIQMKKEQKNTEKKVK